MNDLVPINPAAAFPVDARDLHAALESRQQFTNWIQSRIRTYHFTEGIDWERAVSPLNSPNMWADSGGPTRHDYALTIDMAKELSMLENTERGRKVRLWFIQREQQARELEQRRYPVPGSYAEALRLAADEHERADGSGLLSMAATGQALGLGRNRFYEWCREKRYIKLGRREPYQKWLDAGLFVLKVAKLDQGMDSETKEKRPDRIEQVPLVTPKGLAHFAERISGGIE